MPDRRRALGASLRSLKLPANAAVEAAKGIPRQARIDDRRWRTA